MKHHYPYLIIGGGMTGDAAVRGIRQVDSDSEIGMISQESDPPYNRPPLSKGLWRRSPRPMPLSRIMRNTEKLGVAVHLERGAVSLSPEDKTVTDDQRVEYSYGKLLLATGGSPIRLPGSEQTHERIVYYRTLADYRRLRELTETGQRFLVVGGGFIGSEMAAVLAGLDKEVTMVFPEEGIGARVLPGPIAHHLNRYFDDRNVRVMAGKLVRALLPDQDGVTVQIEGEKDLRVDGVVAGLGIRPNIELAQQAGLDTSDGIHVHTDMRTSQPDIFAAGDVANFYSPALGKRIRVEHEENANMTGQLAGLVMAGQPGTYDHLPSFYSSMFDINYDAVGEMDPQAEIVYDWLEPYQKGAVFFTKQGVVRGVLLWNMSRGLDTARQMITEQRSFQVEELTGKITDL
jgi:3-phenylpropionate/trans-cinnamate dioxygenase ferredoxin reductase component